MRSTPRSPASSAASGSRCCALRPRKWSISSPSACARRLHRADRNNGMTPFELLEPKSLHEAIALLDPDDPTVRPIAGGTALMLMMKSGVFRPRRLVSLRRLGDQLTRIAAGADGHLSIGAMTPLAAIEHSPEV